MISNQDDINNYSNLNKIYIPTTYVNQNYQYRLNGDYLTIVTNINCYNNYNTQYCDCYYYNYKNNVITNSYSCSTNSNNTQTIPFTSITDDINYSQYIRQTFTNDYIIYFLTIILAVLLVKMFTQERKCL